MKPEESKLNPTCLVTGKTDHLLMYAIRSPEGNMIGWVFLHESIKMEEVETTIKWDYKVSIKKAQALHLTWLPKREESDTF